MKTATLEEMWATFDAASGACDSESGIDCDNAGLLAVIEKHIGPMLAEARLSGMTDTAESMTLTALGKPQTPIESSKDYAARVISQIKGQS